LRILAWIPIPPPTAIKSNIGLRQQDKLTSDQAAFIAACRSTQVDISLSF
jgi:hypothetical protein